MRRNNIINSNKIDTKIGNIDNLTSKLIKTDNIELENIISNTADVKKLSLKVKTELIQLSSGVQQMLNTGASTNPTLNQSP